MTSDLTAGLTLVEDITTAAEGLRNGDWLSTTLGSLSVGASMLDPVGTLFEQGIGWVLEHLQPLSGWLDQLTGDPAQVYALANSWTSISHQLTESAEDLIGMVRSDLAEFEGLVAEEYWRVQSLNATTLDSLSQMASSISSALEASSQMVQTVHDLVRDTIAMIVSAVLASLATAWIPVYGQVRLGTEIAELVGKYVPDIKRVIDNLKQAFSVLQDLLKRAGDVLRSLRAKLGGLMPSNRVTRKAAANVDELADVRHLDEATGMYRLSDPVDVDFEVRNYDRVEYSRQLADQEAGMNELTVQEFLDNRDHYLANERSGRKAQEVARHDEIALRTEKILEENPTLNPRDAKAFAEESLKGQHALHAPDQVAGGHPDRIIGFGDGNINSSIGRQWQDRIGPVDEHIRKLAETMTPEQRANTLLNINLNLP